MNKDILTIFEEDITEEINHGMRVSNLAYHVGKEYGLYPDECHELAVAGMLHDIGKLCVAANIYGRKEGVLRVEEMRYIQMHPRLGHELLMRYDYSDYVVEAVLYHHENCDGSGYPSNLMGREIPLSSRILRVCDVYAALTSNRPYRKAFDKDTAVELMIEEIKNFDMKVFLAFQRAIHDEALQSGLDFQRIKVRIIEEENENVSVENTHLQ